jgi:hypothetical protein
MVSLETAVRAQLARQVAHWSAATARLHKPADLAAEAAWSNVERYLGVTIRQHLAASVERLQQQAAALRTCFVAATSHPELEVVRKRLLDFRRRYLRVETTLDFYADAINARINPAIGAQMRACDSLAHRSMAMVLDQIGKPVPVVLTYPETGIGASILKAGLRLWDGSESPVAAVKITRHNLHRPTSLIHEAGHQCFHIAGWNDELASVLLEDLTRTCASAAEPWAAWASEISADAHAFVHTGYASVAALHDVLAGEPHQVFRCVPGDPHPIAYLRVLLGVEMCRRFFGAGPWDDLAVAWVHQHPLERADAEIVQLIRLSLPLLPRIVELILLTPMKSFGGRALSALVNPDRVKPEALDQMERQLGAALYTSTHWVWTEALRLLALTGLKLAVHPEHAAEILTRQSDWMLALGGAAQAA